MSKSSRNYRPNKRKGSQPVQTKRTSKNKHNWEKRVGYSSREIARAEYFKLKNRQRRAGFATKAPLAHTKAVKKVDVKKLGGH